MRDFLRATPRSDRCGQGCRSGHRLPQCASGRPDEEHREFVMQRGRQARATPRSRIRSRGGPSRWMTFVNSTVVSLPEAFASDRKPRAATSTSSIPKTTATWCACASSGDVPQPFRKTLNLDQETRGGVGRGRASAQRRQSSIPTRRPQPSTTVSDTCILINSLLQRSGQTLDSLCSVCHYSGQLVHIAGHGDIARACWIARRLGGHNSPSDLSRPYTSHRMDPSSRSAGHDASDH
jgi:hypothetical protein